MSQHTTFGQSGEAIAFTHLIKSGYNVLEKNWRTQHLEVDIIAENESFIVFVEVKTRRSNAFGEPEIFVNKQKQRHLIRAANQYVEQKKIDKEVRFDIISIVHAPGADPQIHHIQDAFYPS